MTYYTRTPFVQGTLVRSAEANAQLQAIEEGFDLLPTETQLKRGTVTFAVDSGTKNHLVVALPFPLTAGYPADGLEISVQIAVTNDDEADINVDAQGVVPIKQFNGNALEAGDLPAGAIVKLSWNNDDVEFRLQGASPGNIVAAEGSAVAAAASAAAASSSASTASGHATAAQGHANTASGHASDAADSAIEAADAQAAAEVAQAAAEAAQAGAEIAQAAAEAAGPVLATKQAATSGTAINFTGIPAGVKRITVMLVGVSTNGTSPLVVQIGDSGGLETAGYSSIFTQISGAAVGGTNGVTDGFALSDSATGAVWKGTFTLTLQDSATNTWVCTFMMVRSDVAITNFGAGTKALTAVLDRVTLTTQGGTNTFDAGSINILYE